MFLGVLDMEGLKIHVFSYLIRVMKHCSMHISIKNLCLPFGKAIESIIYLQFSKMYKILIRSLLL